MGAASTERDEWLSLQEASQRVGVSPATLRAWADRGRVPTFRTPGGHRRFRESDLAALAASGQEAAPLQNLHFLAHAALGRTRFEVTEGWMAEKEWYRRFSAAARDEHRELGRRVILAMAELMSGSEPLESAKTRAEDLGNAYGALNRKHEIPLGDALRAFLFFRDSFIESLTELAQSAPPLEVLVLLRRASSFADTVLLAMVDSYTAPLPKKRRAG